MNKHLSEGQLRAALDGELDSEAHNHLEACPDCQTRQKTVQSQVQRIVSKLDFLSSARNDSLLPAPRAWSRFNQTLIQKETPMFKKLFAAPLVRYGVPALLVLTMIFAFPGARALASQLLDLFRVQQVAVVPVDVTGIGELNGNDALAKQISQLISDSTTVTKEPGDPVEANDTNQASELAGFTVRAPEGMEPARISVTSGAAFTLTVNGDKAQALLNEAGRDDLVLPETIDGAEISVDIPSGVNVPMAPASHDAREYDPDEQSSRSQRYADYTDCVMFAQIPSPTVTAPPSIDVPQLAQMALEFTGMKSEEAKALTESIDWTSTLVIPIPRNGSTYEEVSVDGVTGTLIQRSFGSDPEYMLLWVRMGSFTPSVV
jgi:hypothetical protein